MNGYGNGTFGAENILTREQLASVLTKAFKLKPKSMTTFDDVEKIIGLQIQLVRCNQMVFQ